MNSDYTGHCLCGKIKYKIKNDCKVIYTFFCYCDSCRRIHSAPVYEACYVGKDELEITEGKEFVKVYQCTWDDFTRNFCSNCGTIIFNEVTSLKIKGFFPNTLDSSFQKNIPDKFKPNMHICVDEALNVNPHEDGLPKLTTEQWLKALNEAVAKAIEEDKQK